MGWSPFRPTGLTYCRPEASFEGYTLITPLGGDSTLLLDMAGRVVHRWRMPGMRLNSGYLLENGNLLLQGLPRRGLPPFRAPLEDDPPSPLRDRARFLPNNATFLREIDWEGKTVWEYRCDLLHHDFFKTGRGTYLFTRWVEIDHALSEMLRGERVAAGPRNPLLTDEFVEIDRDGRKVWSVRLDEVFDPDLDPIGPLERHLEWTHTNSICEDESGQLLFSCKNNNRVGVIDKKTKKLVWRYGAPETSGQHHASYVKGGNVQIFDNGLRRIGLPYSRVIEVDPASDKIVWEYKADPPISFFSPNISGAERLPNGNCLVCEGAPGRIFEVTRSGEVVWEWQNPFSNAIRDMQTSYSVMRAYRYGADHPGLLGRVISAELHREINRNHGLDVRRVSVGRWAAAL